MGESARMNVEATFFLSVGGDDRADGLSEFKSTTELIETLQQHDEEVRLIQWSGSCLK